MTDKRYLIIIAVLLTALGFLIWWITSRPTEHENKRSELLEELEGRHKINRRVGTSLATGTVERSRRAADRLLEIRLPEGDPRARAGGAVVLTLQGNNVLLRRPDLAAPACIKNVLGLKAADALLEQVLAMEESPEESGPLFILKTVVKAGTRSVSIGPVRVLPLLTEPHLQQQSWTPPELRLLLAPAGPDIAVDAALPWPFRRPDPKSLCEPDQVLRAPRDRIKRFLERWRPDLVFKDTGDPPGYYQVARLLVLE